MLQAVRIAEIDLPPAELEGRHGLTERFPEALRARIRPARELARRREREPLPTGVPALDELLAGGLPRGELVELLGHRSSGRLSLVIDVLAGATAAGESAALIDLGDHLDPGQAAAAGCDLERLLWVRPRRGEHALAAAEMLLGAGFPLVVLELGLPPVPGGRGIEAAWLRLARAAEAREAALLVSAPYRASGTAAGAVLKLDRAPARWLRAGSAPPLLSGLEGALEIEKRRGGAAGERGSLVRRAPEALEAPVARPPRAAAIAHPRLLVRASA